MENEQVIVSFDVGIKNLACCVLKIDDAKKRQFSIFHWEILDLTTARTTTTRTSTAKNLPVQTLISNLVLTLDEMRKRIPSIAFPSFVLIENQPKCNIKMKSISLALFTYFVIRCQVDSMEERQTKVEYVHAGNKTNAFISSSLLPPSSSSSPSSSPPKTTATTYQQRKKLAIALTLQLIEDEEEKWKDYFLSLNKKDDAADAYLQALYYCLRHRLISPPHPHLHPK